VCADSFAFEPSGVTVEVALLPNGVTVEVELLPSGVTVEVELLPNGVTVEVLFVPAGVPALSELDATEFPVNVGAVFVPVAVVVWEWVPRTLPVNVGAATVPAGVKLTVPFVPAGVIESFPPVVPTSPFATSVPNGIFPLRAATSVNPAGHASSIIITAPRGRDELVIDCCPTGTGNPA